MYIFLPPAEKKDETKKSTYYYKIIHLMQYKKVKVKTI